MGWPVKLVKFSKTLQMLHVEFDTVMPGQVTDWHDGKPYVFTTWSGNWEHYWAYSCEWHSWAWQCNMVPGCQSKHKPALRLCCKGVERSFLKVAAESAFWDLSATDLKLVATVHKFHVDEKAKCFEVLFSVTKQALRLTDDQKVLDILKHRMANLQPSKQSVDQFLEIDEAHEVLDVEDIEEVTRERDRLKKSKAAFEHVGEEFSAKKR